MPIPIDISASRGAGILGISPYKSQVAIWLEIMESRKPGFCAERNYTLPEPPDNAAIKWGSAFEDSIIYLAENRLNDKIIDRERLFQFDYLSCHIDGMYKESKNVHEGKTTSQYYFRDNFGEPGSNRIPREHQVQVQHQMILTHAEKCILSVLVFPTRPDEWERLGMELEKSDAVGWMIKNNLARPQIRTTCANWAAVLNEMGYFHQYEISEDKKLQSVMIENYIYFWETFILGEKEPPAMLYSDFALLVKNPNGTILADEQVERWASEYKQINSENSELTKRKDQLKNLMLDYMKTQDSGFEKIIDDDSREKWVLRDRKGRKLFQYNGKIFR